MKRPRSPAGGGHSPARDPLTLPEEPGLLEEKGQDFVVTRESIRSIDTTTLRKLRRAPRDARLLDFLEDRPRFLEGTFAWTKRGYRYAAPPPADLDAAPGDAWRSLVALLERAKRGDPMAVRGLARSLGEPSASPSLRYARLSLLADAGSADDLAALADFMRDGPDDLRVDACWAASLAGAAWLAPAMVEAYSRVGGAADREAIGFFVSDLLEEEGGAIARAVRGRAGRFERVATAAIASLGTERVPRWFGEVFSVRGLALRMAAMLRDAPREAALSGAFIPLRHKLEAATGLDCSGFFVLGELAPKRAAPVIDAFLASPEAARYQPGIRYFFGHPRA